jgi:hypothetical protein
MVTKLDFPTASTSLGEFEERLDRTRDREHCRYWETSPFEKRRPRDHLPATSRLREVELYPNPTGIPQVAFRGIPNNQVGSGTVHGEC